MCHSQNIIIRIINQLVNIFLRISQNKQGKISPKKEKDIACDVFCSISLSRAKKRIS